MVDALDVDFKRAVTITSDPKSASLFTDSAKLRLYTLYKQAVDGDIPADKPCPPLWQVVPRAKHKGWEELKGMSQEEAKRLYIQMLVEADPTFMITIPTAEQSPNTNISEVTTEPSNEESSNKKTGAVSQTPISVASPATNVMLLPAIWGCGGMIGLGIFGFFFSTLSWTALFFLGLVLAGLGGLIGSLLLTWDEYGLIAIMPSFVSKLLYETTLLEFIVEDKFLVEIKEIVTQILPAALAKDEARMYQALSAMSPRLRRSLTTRGMARLLSKPMQRIMLPRLVRNKLASQPPTFQLPAEIPTDSVKLSQVVNQGKPTDKPDLERARLLFNQLFSEALSKRNAELVLAWLNPKSLQQVSVALTAATVVQLFLSADSRRFFLGFIRGFLLLASMVGAGASGALLFLWMIVKKSQRNRPRQ